LTADAEDVDRADTVGGIDPDVVEVAALAHDLGHPPFGHIGENELDRLLRDAGVTDGFEGNAQTFRIVTKLACRDPINPGLDLTMATLNATLKYPWLRDQRTEDEIRMIGNDGERLQAERRHNKWGAYTSEQDDFNRARAISLVEADKESPEAALMDWADDISYAIHDFEDFYRAGLIDPSRFVDEEAEDFLVQAAGRLRKKDPRQFDDIQWTRAFRRIRGNLAEDDWRPIARTYTGSREQRGLLHKYSSWLLTKYMDAVGIGNSTRSIIIGTEAWHEVNVLKELTSHYVIRRPALATVQRGQRQTIRALFHELNEWIDEEPGSPRLPALLRETLETARERPEEHPDTEEEARRLQMRAVADFIALLTEPQTLGLHQELTGTKQGSVLGTWLR